jgi:hypothetical protein
MLPSCCASRACAAPQDAPCESEERPQERGAAGAPRGRQPSGCHRRSKSARWEEVCAEAERHAGRRSAAFGTDGPDAAGDAPQHLPVHVRGRPTGGRERRRRAEENCARPRPIFVFAQNPTSSTGRDTRPSSPLTPCHLPLCVVPRSGRTARSPTASAGRRETFHPTSRECAGSSPPLSPRPSRSPRPRRPPLALGWTGWTAGRTRRPSSPSGSASASPSSPRA